MDQPLRLGKYRVIRKLGEGATSDVFLARDDFNDRDVAVKCLRASDGQDIDERTRASFFASESALAGRLHHPNVVQILDASPDGPMPYVVMEYVGGSTLREHCRPGQLLPLEQVIEIGFKCAMALDYCFRQGIVHRDVKPANVLTITRGAVVTDVKLTDFGSALNLGADSTQVHRVGSLAYMSPEQLDGATLDFRTDVYALGAVLYHLIAGRPPFDAPNQGALMNRIYHQPPAPLTELRRGLHEMIDAVVQRALAKRPEDRFASWDEFAQALSALVSQQAVPRSQLHDVLDSERFNLLRGLDFFSGFGDVELWEVVQRADWQRFAQGHPLFTRGEEGSRFHIIAKGAVEVYRNGKRVASLGSGTSVGEMAYLAPNPQLRRHSTDVTVTQPATTISFTPETMAQLSAEGRHLFDQAFIRVLVRRLHAAHEALAHPRRIL
jgi:eukaryotic-like serine/threonine-protein kinase